jgi:succinate dehydrogenase / fumarate reductase cytochrome b subunit
MRNAHTYRPWSAASPMALKALMAVTGLALVTWCVLHVAGNLLTLLGPELVNRYGAALHDSPVLWLQRLGLSLAATAHVAAAIRLARCSQQATGGHRRLRLTFAGTMRHTGTAMLALTAIHIASIYGVAHPDFVPGDVHHNLGTLVRTVAGASVLIALTALFGFHVGHGLRSALTSMGLTARAWPRAVSRLVGALPMLFVVGFGLPIAWALLN